MNIERRDFFKILSAGVATAAGTKEAQARQYQHRGRNSDAPAILYDATICIGCKTCEVGCKKANDLPVEQSDLDKWHGVNEVWDSKSWQDVSSGRRENRKRRHGRLSLWQNCIVWYLAYG